MQFRGIKSSPEVVPVGYADQPLIAIGECLPTELGIHPFRAELEIGLPEVEVIVPFRAHDARSVRAIGVPLP